MRYFWILLGLAATLILSGCCRTCDKESLGAFNLQNDSPLWLDWAQQNSFVYENANGNEMVVSITESVSDVEEQLTNCEDLGNCGLCCNSFFGESRYLRLQSTNLEVVIDILLRKDFLRFTPADNPAEIEDYLSITFNNRLSCDIFNLPDTVLTTSVELNGNNFNNVLACQASSQAGDLNVPVAVYFNRVEGVVGFELAQPTGNVVWHLQ